MEKERKSLFLDFTLTDPSVFLQKHPEVALSIAGHTHNAVKQSHDLILSQKRAEAVLHFLVQQGICIERLPALGFGSSKPVASQATEAGRTQSRRVEVEVLGKE